jgi:RNA polymerase sigma-70 factor (ECF subfamily)
MAEGANEADLLQRARDGDPRAIRTLYDRHAPRVYAVTRRLAGDDSLAEDWAQDAWLQAIRGLASFRGQSSFGTWLHRIAVNAALHGLRQLERRTGRDTALTDELGSPGTGDQTILRISLERALDQVPAGMRAILVMHDVEGYTHEEIGEMLGINPGTSKSQLFKARARMRQLLQPANAALEGE